MPLTCYARYAAAIIMMLTQYYVMQRSYAMIFALRDEALWRAIYE